MNKMKPVFEALNQELSQKNLFLTIICVGGYVLEYHGLRATQDVDAFYEETHHITLSGVPGWTDAKYTAAACAVPYSPPYSSS